MLRRHLASIGLSALLSAASAGAVPVYVKIAPPAPKVEVRVVAPGRGYVWVGGYYRWHAGAYVWVPGGWKLPPHAGAVWVPGHWKSTPSGWYWRPGHWR